MPLDPDQARAGVRVVYQARHAGAPRESGTLTSDADTDGEPAAFVRYDTCRASKLTFLRDLNLEN